MNKKKSLIFLTFLAILPSLTSCLFVRGLLSSSSSSAAAVSNLPGNYASPSYTSDFKTANLTRKNVGLSLGQRYLPSTGNSKILVVPVQLSDYPFTTTKLNRLQNTFFGTADETGWQSVSSFYQASSYGKLSLSGTVTSPVKFSYTSTEMESMATSYSKQNKGNYSDVVLASALKALSDNGSDFSSYDSDSDGYIDAIWLVYSCPFNSNSDFYWAYTTWADNSTLYGNKNICLYSWASVDFLTEQSYGLLTSDKNGDAHTFVHETGHMLGLDDYYSYDCDNKTNFDTPVGGVDMMDFNIGDHDSYSKYLLDWITPTVITPEYLAANGNTLTLTSLTESGKAFLLPSYKNGSTQFNGTAFDEYLLIEYYTPTELNEADSLVAYGTNGLKEYTKPGVLVYHVDASVGKLLPDSKGNVYWDGAIYDKLPTYDDSTWGKYFAYYYIYSNTASYSYDTSFSDAASPFYRGRLISLLPATGMKIMGRKTGYSTNNSLYTTGSVFGSKGVYSSFIFEDGTVPEYGFEVTSTSSSDCQLTFSAF
jgi:M6 family metalloprotease-like protein